MLEPPAATLAALLTPAVLGPAVLSAAGARHQGVSQEGPADGTTQATIKVLGKKQTVRPPEAFRSVNTEMRTVMYCQHSHMVSVRHENTT